MLKKIMFSIFAVILIFIFSKSTYSKEVERGVTINSGQPTVSLVLNPSVNNNLAFFDGHRRHRGPFYFYYTEPLQFRHYGHRHRENERRERHESREKHEKRYNRHHRQ